MESIELIARRKRLGLSQEELGRCIALVSPMPDGSPRPPIKQATIASWEGSRGIPLNIDMSIQNMLDMIDERTDVMCDRVKELIVHSSGVRDTPFVEVRAYATDGALWKDWPDMSGWPCVLWNISATVAIDEARDEYGIDARLMDEEW